MLNQYIEMLKKATETLSNLGKSGAGIGDYFCAVGYELLLFALGVLYLAAIIIIIVLPAVMIKQIWVNNRFASKRWKQYMAFMDTIKKFFINYRINMSALLSANSKETFLLNFEKLKNQIESIGITMNSSVITNKEVQKCLKNQIDAKKIDILIPKYFPRIIDMSYREIMECIPSMGRGPLRNDLFYDWVKEFGNFSTELKTIYPDDLSYKKSLVWHYIVKIGLTVLLLLIYLILLIPFVLVFF